VVVPDDDAAVSLEVGVGVGRLGNCCAKRDTASGSGVAGIVVKELVAVDTFCDTDDRDDVPTGVMEAMLWTAGEGGSKKPGLG
jgi:hypothetical protein